MVAALGLAAVATVAFGLDAPSPEECIANESVTTAVSVSYGGKSYRLTSEACRAQFLTDPERYAQLYDALLELEREGKPRRAPSTASLVPS